MDRPQEQAAQPLTQKEALLEIGLIDSNMGFGAHFVLGDPDAVYGAYLLCAGYERQGEYDMAISVGLNFRLFSEGGEKFLELKQKALRRALESKHGHYEQIANEARKYGFDDIAREATLRRAEDIISIPGHELDPGYKLARGELKDDQIFLQRFARAVLERKIKYREFNTLPDFLAEFGEHLSARQRALGAFIVDNAERLKDLPSLPK